MKIQRVVTLELETWQEMKRLGFNISQACNEGIKNKLQANRYKDMSLDELLRLKAKRDRIEALTKELGELKDG